MCGLLGEMAFESRLTEVDRFQRLLALSRSRGPDGTRVETVGNRLRFGFNRLSVVDLSENAHQPMWSPSQRYLIIFNGEIYNHFELRNKLSRKGNNLKSYGDTATLAACFDEWGIQGTVIQLDGMFAIGIWDQYENSLSLVKDFAGIKPLFYGWNGETLVFASQYNQVSRHPAFYNEPINQEVLKLYLTQHFVPPPFGLLKNTYSVNPGEIITFHMDGKKDSDIYWCFPEYSQINFKENDAINKTDYELSSAVQSELMSDVPLGAFLSGGVDSPLVCYHASSNNSNDFETFSMGSDSPVHDESFLSRQYAEFLGTKHYAVEMNAKNSLEALEKAVIAAGEPMGDFSILPTWQLSKLASSRVTVALSGDGGDELFFGYERFRSIAKNHWLWHFPYPVRYLVRGMDRLIVHDKYVNECILKKTPGEAHFGLHSRFPIDLLKNLIPNLGNISLPDDYDTYEYSNPRDRDKLLHLIRRAEFYGMLQKTLAKVDRASMAHSLEVRVPFLKKTMIEKVVAMGINAHQPMKERKFILYKLLQRSFPEIQPEKTKKGFSVPLTGWIRTAFKEPFYQTLLDNEFCQSYGIEKKSMENMLNVHVAGQKDLKWPLFTLYSLAVWTRKGRSLA